MKMFMRMLGRGVQNKGMFKSEDAAAFLATSNRQTSV